MPRQSLRPHRHLCAEAGLGGILRQGHGQGLLGVRQGLHGFADLPDYSQFHPSASAAPTRQRIARFRQHSGRSSAPKPNARHPSHRTAASRPAADTAPERSLRQTRRRTAPAVSFDRIRLRPVRPSQQVVCTDVVIIRQLIQHPPAFPVRRFRSAGKRCGAYSNIPLLLFEICHDLLSNPQASDLHKNHPIECYQLETFKSDNCSHTEPTQSILLSHTLRQSFVQIRKLNASGRCSRSPLTPLHRKQTVRGA